MSAIEGRPTVRVTGIGEVGRYLLEGLAREPGEWEIVAGDLSPERVQPRIDNATLGAAMHGRHHQIRAVELDLRCAGERWVSHSRSRGDAASESLRLA